MSTPFPLTTVTSRTKSATTIIGYFTFMYGPNSKVRIYDADKVELFDFNEPVIRDVNDVLLYLDFKSGGAPPSPYVNTLLISTL